MLKEQTSVIESTVEVLNSSSNVIEFQQFKDRINKIQYFVNDLSRNRTTSEIKNKLILHIQELRINLSAFITMFSNSQDKLLDVIVLAINGFLHPSVTASIRLVYELNYINQHLDNLGLPIA